MTGTGYVPLLRETPHSCSQQEQLINVYAAPYQIIWVMTHLPLEKGREVIAGGMFSNMHAAAKLFLLVCVLCRFEIG